MCRECVDKSRGRWILIDRIFIGLSESEARSEDSDWEEWGCNFAIRIGVARARTSSFYYRFIRTWPKRKRARKKCMEKGKGMRNALTKRRFESHDLTWIFGRTKNGVISNLASSAISRATRVPTLFPLALSLFSSLYTCIDCLRLIFRLPENRLSHRHCKLSFHSDKRIWKGR